MSKKNKSRAKRKMMRSANLKAKLPNNQCLFSSANFTLSSILSYIDNDPELKDYFDNDPEAKQAKRMLILRFKKDKTAEEELEIESYQEEKRPKLILGRTARDLVKANDGHYYYEEDVIDGIPNEGTTPVMATIKS